MLTDQALILWIIAAELAVIINKPMWRIAAWMFMINACIIVVITIINHIAGRKDDK